MGSLEMTCLDLESGVGCSSSAVSNDVKDESICVSKATEGSCSSQYYSASDSSNQGHDSDSEIDQVSHSRRVSSVVATDCVVDIDQNGVDEVRISVEIMERDCRICMLSLDSESGIAIELGCSCKNELAAVHQHCAETWFASKGNRICEVCKTIAKNIVIPKHTQSSQRIFEDQVTRSSTNLVPMPVPERNTLSTNAISVPVSGRNAPSTNAASQVITVPRSLDLAARSSTSVCDRVCGILLIYLFIGGAVYFILVLPILYIFT